MTDEILQVRSLLEAAQRKLRDLDKQVLGLRAEIAAYEKVCAILSGQDMSASNGKGNGAENLASKKSRGLSETWKMIVYWISCQEAPPETEHIYAFTQQSNLNVNRNTLRSQLSVYTSQGILKRVDGHYLVSVRGMELLNQQLGESLRQDEPEQYTSVFRDAPESEETVSDLDSELPL